MGNKKAEQTLERVSKLNGQERIDALITLFYSNARTQLTNDQYIDLALPPDRLLSDLYNAASSDCGAITSHSNPLEARWKCTMLGFYQSFCRDDYDSEYVEHVLEDVLTEERMGQLRNGSPYSEDEWRQVRDRESANVSASGSAVVSLETKGKHDRSMYFVATFGDWGTYLGCRGPFSYAENLLSDFENVDEILFEWSDEGSEACTPNWNDDDCDDDHDLVFEVPRNTRTNQLDLLSYEYPKDPDSAFPKCPMDKPPFGSVSINDIDCLRTDESLKLNKQFSFGLIPETIIYEDEKWSFTETLKLRWHKGRLHLGDLHLQYCWDGFPLHFHCDLNVNEEKFHLDLYGMGQWGPGRSRKDILVFREKSLVARGSKGNQSIASFRANIPLAFRTKYGLIVVPTIDAPKNPQDLNFEVTYWHLSSCNGLTEAGFANRT